MLWLSWKLSNSIDLFHFPGKPSFHQEGFLFSHALYASLKLPTEIEAKNVTFAVSKSPHVVRCNKVHFL